MLGLKTVLKVRLARLRAHVGIGRVELGCLSNQVEGQHRHGTTEFLQSVVRGRLGIRLRVRVRVRVRVR